MTSSLIPDALQPLKSQAIKSIRSFAKQLDGWLVTSLSELEAPGLLDIKRKGTPCWPRNLPTPTPQPCAPAFPNAMSRAMY
jgi:hypothetical protein